MPERRREERAFHLRLGDRLDGKLRQLAERLSLTPTALVRLILAEEVPLRLRATEADAARTKE